MRTNHYKFYGGTMINIYILEDNQQVISDISRLVANYNPEFKLHCIDNNYENFITSYVHKSSTKNIYIIDINLESSTDGLTIASEIRQIDYTGYIIFVTSHIDLAPKNYALHLKAINFIDKSSPDYLSILKRTLETIDSENSNLSTSESMITLRDEDSVLTISSEEIVYVETTHRKRKLKVNTISSQHTYSGSLKQMSLELPSHFRRVHKSFLANTKMVSEIDTSLNPNQIVFKNDQRCDISKKFVPNIIDFLQGKDR